jgi:hypothetical protein
MKKLFFLFMITNIATGMQAQDIEQKLKEKGIVLTTPSQPIANYVNAVRVGNLLYLSGKGPMKADGTNITGKVGEDVTIDEDYQAARLTGIKCWAW